RGLGVLDDIGGVIDRGRALARLIEQRERSGGRGIGQRAAGNRDGVLGYRVRRQQPPHALACIGPSVVPLPLLARALLARPPRASGAAPERSSANSARVSLLMVIAGGVIAASLA